jgi:hypothetical protein
MKGKARRDRVQLMRKDFDYMTRIWAFHHMYLTLHLIPSILPSLYEETFYTFFNSVCFEIMSCMRETLLLILPWQNLQNLIVT